METKPPVMSLEELRMRLSMSRALKDRYGRPGYFVSAQTYDRMGDAIEFYTQLGIEIEPKPFKGD